MFLVQFTTRSEERIAVLSNTITRNRSLQHTTCDLYWESSMHEDWRRAKLRSIPVSKVPSSFTETKVGKSGQQDQPDQELGKSSDHLSASSSCGETRSNNIDNRISGIPQSTVQQQDTNRRERVKKLIQQFENHTNKEFFLKDLNKTEEINEFSEESKKLITDMKNTVIFELCETSSEKQCADCAWNWEIGLSVVLLEEVYNPRKSCTRTTSTSHRFPVAPL